MEISSYHISVWALYLLIPFQWIALHWWIVNLHRPSASRSNDSLFILFLTLNFKKYMKICPSNWIISPSRGQNKNLWNHHLDNCTYIIWDAPNFLSNSHPSWRYMFRFRVPKPKFSLATSHHPGWGSCQKRVFSAGFRIQGGSLTIHKWDYNP